MRDFCGWEQSPEGKTGALPVGRDPGLAALKIQLPRSLTTCLFAMWEGRGPGSWDMGV